MLSVTSDNFKLTRKRHKSARLSDARPTELNDKKEASKKNKF